MKKKNEVTPAATEPQVDNMITLKSRALVSSAASHSARRAVRTSRPCGGTVPSDSVLMPCSATIKNVTMATNYDGCTSYVDFRMREWGMDGQPRRIQTIVRRVLNEMEPAALLFLKDPRFEVMVLPGEHFAVWPYFTINRRRCIVKEAVALGLPPKDETRVLLVLGARSFEKEPVELLADYLRDGLGHVLLYLRAPKARTTAVTP